MIRCLLEYFPAAAMATDETGWMPLHYTCVTVNIIQLLIDAAPNSGRQADIKGRVPLHCLCVNDGVKEITLLNVLKFYIKKCPEAVRNADNENGFLPLHIASGSRSPEFCCVLIEAYPGSERTYSIKGGMLPLHLACLENNAATVEYLYTMYPDAVNHAPARAMHPILYAITGMSDRDDPTVAVEIVECLLDCDPNAILLKFADTSSLLHFACWCEREHTDSNLIEVALEIVKILYDAHPEAIEDITFVLNIHHFHQQIQPFINRQLFYSRLAKDHGLMTTPDGNGQLPLHTALQNNVRLGSIKLLVTGNPAALQSPDNSGTLPLHVACEHHDSPSVVQYLIGLDTTTLDAVDREGNTALHYACRSAKYDMITLLLDEYDAVSVSKRNAHKKLPIDLLWESNEVQDRESIEHTESVFRLLKAYPEIVMNVGMKSSATDQNGRKRKLDNV